jgi:hypothetical protein
MKVDYSKTFIYKLCCNDINIKEIYVGHSTDFKSRNQDHKTSCNNPNNKKYNYYKYKFIRDNGGYENWKMIKLYDYPCNSKREAEAEEDKTMRELNASLNSHRAFLTEEERIEQNKQYNEKFRENNKEYLKQYEEKRKNEPKRIEYNKQYNEKRKNEKVKCEFCNSELRLDNLKRHQKTIKCLKHQECMILD